MPDFPAELFRMEGDPAAVRSSADAWAGFGTTATTAAGRIRDLDTSEFVGPEGDLFRARLTAEIPPHLEVTGTAFGRAAGALSAFATALAGPEEKAAAEAALAEAQRRWDECVTQATALRTELVSTVETAATEVDAAAGMRFTEAAFQGQVGGSVTGTGQARAGGDLGPAQAGTDGIEASDVLRGVSVVAGVLSFIPVLAPFTVPIAIGTGLAAAGLDAVEYAETGEGDPGRIAAEAGLSLLPGIGGLGRVLGAGRPLLRAPALLRPQAAAAGGRLFARPLRALERDPVDVASGEMVLRQTDVALPGLLPLLLERTHLTSYRVGGWFGRSWASTLDQRLEVDAGGICLATADGLLLAYPPPVDGPVLPAEGPRLPLAAVDGGYTVTDRDRTLHFGPGRPGPADGVRTYPLAAVSDRNGQRIEFRRDPDGTPTEVTHTGGYRIAVRTEHGRVTALRLGGRDADLVRYGYDERGDLVAVVDSSGRALRLDYDPVGRIVRWEDRTGEWYGYRHDVAGRVVRTTGSGGCLAGTLAYEPGRTVVTDSLGHRTEYHVTPQLQVHRVVDPLGHARTYEWDRYDRLVGETDPFGRTTEYRWNDAGDLVELVRPDGTRSSAEYDGRRLPVRVVEPDGAVWTREHDAAGNLTAVTDPTGATTCYEYAAGGHLRRVVDALGGVRLVETDAAGLPVAVTDPLGAVTRWDRDDLGRVVAVTDPLGHRSGLERTVEGRLVRRTGPDGSTESWVRDPEGHVQEHVDAAGQRTRHETTHFALPAARTGPDGARTELTYDTELRLVAVTDPIGRVWRYEYDPAGNLVRETDVTGRVIGYSYDAAGQLVGRTNGAGETVHIGRDALGRVVRRRHGEEVTEFEHDPAGRLVRAVSGGTELRVARDPLGRVLAETCAGRTVASAYDPLGRRVARRTPSGAESRWEFDAAGRPAALHTAGRTVRFGHDPAGREVERRIDAELLLTRDWDPAGRLLAEASPAGRRQLTHRADGILTGDGHRRFDLDPAGRITAVHGKAGPQRYAYDPAGRPQWRARRVRCELDGQGRVVVRHRRTLSGGRRTWRYGWDAEDRLVSVTTPDGDRWRYAYDPLGRRVAKQRLAADGGIAEQVEFSWDGPVLAERSAAGRTTRWDWEPGSARPVTQVDSSARDDAFHAVVTDLVGTPTALVGPSGTVDWRAGPDLWGAGGTADCPLRFPGQYADPESGLHYNVFRHYDPDTARYASADPIGLAGGTDPYAYVPNPLAWLDPLGLAPCTPPGARFEVDGAGTVVDRGSARFAVGSDGVAVDRIGSQDAVSLGRFPAYLRDSQGSGSRAFDLGDTWKAMSARTDRFGGSGPTSEVWYRNRAFLDQAVDRGSEIRLASDPYSLANANSFFMREVEHMQSRGYTISGDRTHLLPPGGH